MNKKFSYKIDKSGKSDAIFVNSRFQIKNKDIINLKKKGKNKSILRLCLHKNKKSSLHCMLLYLKKKNQNLIHSHKNRDEVYILIEGKMKIKIFDKKKRLKEAFILDKKNPIYFMNKKVIHLTESITNHCIFLEVRKGPFIRKDTQFY
jgi:cupin fold WbuC family metalloprotein|tara:strand:+ start:381 stop:824 length:444 start_codon:yes stop_codon:yes gene_type:complete